MDGNEESVRMPCIPWMDELFDRGYADIGKWHVKLKQIGSIDILHDKLNETQRAFISYLLMSGLGYNYTWPKQEMALAAVGDNENCHMVIRGLNARESEIIKGAEKSDDVPDFCVLGLPPEGERILFISDFDAQMYTDFIISLEVKEMWTNDYGEEDFYNTRVFTGISIFEREDTYIHVVEIVPPCSTARHLMDYMGDYLKRYDKDGGNPNIACEEFFSEVIQLAIRDWARGRFNVLRERKA